jgi:FtsH-binding integral membrane protein
MKYLRNIDFVGQSIILLLLVGFCLMILFTAPLEWDGYMIIILYAQLFLGPWQLLSALIAFFTKANLKELRKIHLVSSLICIVCCAISAWLHNTYSNEGTMAVGVIFFIIIPWCLAILYYSITWRWVFPPRPSGKFLRHVSF